MNIFFDHINYFHHFLILRHFLVTSNLMMSAKLILLPPRKRPSKSPVIRVNEHGFVHLETKYGFLPDTHMYTCVSGGKKCLFCPCNFIKKETLAQVLSCEFCEIFKNTLFIEQLWWLLVIGDIPKKKPTRSIRIW